MAEPEPSNYFIGRREKMPKDHAGLQIAADCAELRRHANRPWLKAWAARELGLPNAKAKRSEAGDAAISGDSVCVSDSALAHHAVLIGATGTGKSRLALQLLSEQIKAGRSAVVLDPKSETIDHVLAACMDVGLSPDQVTLVRPGKLEEGMPGWNPLASGLPAHLAASDLVSVLQRSAAGSWGPRLGDILANALVVLAAHRLSLYELTPLLSEENYRQALLSLVPEKMDAQDGVSYSEAAAFFTREFAAWSKSDRASAVGPVLNKTREMLRSAPLQALFCAQKNTVDLASFWSRQQVLLAHLDSAVLGEEGARMLSGIVAHQLHRTAMRVGHGGHVPVVLCVDELGLQEEFLGSALRSILAVARSKNLRLLAACQHLAQLSPEFKEGLLSQCAVQAFFRLGHSDAKIVASSLSAAEPDRAVRVRASLERVDRETGIARRVVWKHAVLYGSGHSVALDPGVWQMLLWRDLLPIRSRYSSVVNGVSSMSTNGGGVARPAHRSAQCQHAHMADVQRIAAKTGIPRLYVKLHGSGEAIDLESYVSGLSDDEYWFHGPAPLKLVVSFPRPKLTKAESLGTRERMEAWTCELMNLARQHAVLFQGIPNDFNDIARVKVADTRVIEPCNGYSLARFAESAIFGTAHSWIEIQEATKTRTLAVQRLTTELAAAMSEAPEMKSNADNHVSYSESSITSKCTANSNSIEANDALNSSTVVIAQGNTNGAHQSDNLYLYDPAVSRKRRRKSSSIGEVASDGSIS